MGDGIYELFRQEGYSLALCSFSALDQYWGRPSLPIQWAQTDGDIGGLARIFEDLRFPGVELADASVERGGVSWYFRCLDPEARDEGRLSYDILSLSQDGITKRFFDPQGIYPVIRQLRDGSSSDYGPDDPWWTVLNPSADWSQAVMDGALILSRYDTTQESRRVVPVMADYLGERFRGAGSWANLKPEAQRIFLISLLLSPQPDLGLALLKAMGFIDALWPELGRLDGVDHAKEFHPEGNVWAHTLETFRYRKTVDLRLSLGLLLHDVGKPLALNSGRQRFAGHAELGAHAARKFLQRLEFDPSLIQDIGYLVKNHMLPAALKRLPLAKTGDILASPLFPTLLELYRCDESSSFKGLDGYYESSAAYRSYLKKYR